MRIYVGNLSKEFTDVQVNALAAPFGTVTSSVVAQDRSGQSKGFAFVDFGRDEDAKAAIAGLNGKQIEGRLLKVSEARNQTPKDPLGGKY